MIEKRLNSAGRVRWRVRYRTPDQRQRSRTFDRRRDAEDFEAELRGRMRRGEFVDPQRARMNLTGLWEEYERTSLTHLRKTTQQNYRVAIQHALNQFALWPIGKIEHGDVAGFRKRWDTPRSPRPRASTRTSTTTNSTPPPRRSTNCVGPSDRCLGHGRMCPKRARSGCIESSRAPAFSCKHRAQLHGVGGAA